MIHFLKPFKNRKSKNFIIQLSETITVFVIPLWGQISYMHLLIKDGFENTFRSIFVYFKGENLLKSLYFTNTCLQRVSVRRRRGLKY